MAAQLKASNEKIQKNEQNRKELFSGISHDLRSPLTSIKAFAEGLLDGIANTPEAQQEYLQIIKQKTEDVNNMVSQLFLYSKMDMGSYPTNPEKIDIGKEISDFVSASEEEFKVKGLTIKTTDLPCETYIYADPLQLRSIFANLLENSAKYKKANTAEATIYSMTSDEAVNIVIEDNGPGVSEDALPKLFDAFYRVDQSRSNPNRGSGLGLAIVLKALERMGGNIKAENATKGGLRVIIRIPKMKGELSV
jgi:signal transduction histidine kinase